MENILSELTHIELSNREKEEIKAEIIETKVSGVPVSNKGLLDKVIKKYPRATEKVITNLQNDIGFLPAILDYHMNVNAYQWKEIIEGLFIAAKNGSINATKLLLEMRGIIGLKKTETFHRDSNTPFDPNKSTRDISEEFIQHGKSV